MWINVNGKRRELETDTTLARLIKELGVEQKVMAAAVNMEIVKRDQWGVYLLKEGDRVELLHFVGGG